MTEYNILFKEADIVICYKKGIYKFLKGNKDIMKNIYLPHNDVIMFLKSSFKVLYCDDKQNVIETNFESEFIRS